jgi:uroporphyrinogen decarboxylase
MKEKDEVIRAIEFKKPDYIPVWFINKDVEKGDIANYWLFPLGKGVTTEWGYEFTHSTRDDGTMGMPRDPLIPNWEDLENYKFPDPDSEKKYKGIDQFKADNKDRYQIASLGITGFNTYFFLRGFQNALVDFALEDVTGIALLDKIFDIENAVIRNATKYGFDGIMFYDDWGIQKGLMISPEMWRKIFKPRYRDQFRRIHDYGMHVWFHSCGDITSIIPDYNEIGVDVMNISQPNVVDIDKISQLLKGKQCFLVPISYQTVSIKGTPEDIRREARRLYNKLGTEDGGLIGWIEEYSSVGMSDRNYNACIDAFAEIKLTRRVLNDDRSVKK